MTKDVKAGLRRKAVTKARGNSIRSDVLASLLSSVMETKLTLQKCGYWVVQQKTSEQNH